MTLSIDHERIKGNLSHLIATHCLDEDVEFATQGSATLAFGEIVARSQMTVLCSVN
jgi:hypothetical protein